MPETIDARGLTCPQPVILTRKAMVDSPELVTIVNSETSRDNVRRMAERAGRVVSVEGRGDEYHLVIRTAEAEASVPADTTHELVATETAGLAPSGPLVMVVSDKIMGRGDEVLGEILVQGFFYSLGELERRPDTIIFFNAGVWLTVDDSPIHEDLKTLEAQGVTLIACGTCLDYFEIRDRFAAGQVSNMYEIAEIMLAAGKLVML